MPVPTRKFDSGIDTLQVRDDVCLSTKGRDSKLDFTVNTRGSESREVVIHAYIRMLINVSLAVLACDLCLHKLR